MSGPKQLDLFPREEAKTLLDLIKRNLTNVDLLTVSIVAEACNVSCSTVQSWVDGGLVEAINVSGSKTRPYWKIWRKSVIRLMESRLSGG